MNKHCFLIVTGILFCLSVTAQPLQIVRGQRTIKGELIRPADGHDQRLPLAIIAHGFNGNQFFGKAYGQPLNEAGMMVYTFDFPCGSVNSQSNSNTMEMSVLDQVADLKAVVEYFRQQPYVDKKHIVLIGESQGGLVSALAAAEMKNKVDGLVLVYPALCIPDNWRQAYPRLEDIPDTTRLWNVPMGRRYFEEIHDMDPFKVITKYRRPVLIVQGDKDPIVRREDSERAATLYADARIHFIAGAGHGFRPDEFKESVGQILSFVREKLFPSQRR